MQGSGFRVQAARFRVQGAECRVEGVRCRVHGSWFMVHGSGFRVQGVGSRVLGSGFRDQGSGFRVQDSGFRVQGIPLLCRRTRGSWRISYPGGLRTFHQKSTSIRAIDFRALSVANVVTCPREFGHVPPIFEGPETFVVHGMVD